MSNRVKTITVLFAYLFLNSIMFGAFFSRPLNKQFVMIGLICGMVSQILCIYLLWLVRSTNNPARDCYYVFNNWDNSFDGVVGKFEVAPDRKAQLAWEMVKKNPQIYEFGISFIDHEDGTKELVGISLIHKK